MTRHEDDNTNKTEPEKSDSHTHARAHVRTNLF